MLDQYNRHINYLRISVTDRCNFRCMYCMPAEGVPLKKYEDILSFDEITEVVRFGVKQGITKIRITGGEPLVRKDLPKLIRMISELEGIEDYIENLLENIQNNIFKKAYDYRAEHTTKVDTYDEFKEVLNNKGGFISAHWDGTPETEDLIKNETKATIRCMPLEYEEEEGVCIYSGKPSSRRVLFALSY